MGYAMKIIAVEILLEGGHIVTGVVTEIQFESLMGRLHTNSGGVIRVDDGELFEVCIVVDKIAAVRYLRKQEDD